MHPEVLDEKNRTIFQALRNFNDFYLAGGTALALQIGHRISIDFDFFSEREISVDLFDKVEKIFSPDSIHISVNNSDELTLFIDSIKVTFLYYPFPLTDDLTEYEGIKLLSIKEIGASKAYTIGRRGSYKDYVDLYFILSEAHSTLSELIAMAEKKYGDAFNGRLFFEQLVYFDDIENADILFLKKLVDRKEIQSFFENEIKKLSL